MNLFKNFNVPFFFFSLFFISSGAYAQLAAGDIAITTMNSDGTDGIAFVLLKDVEEGTKITFDEKDTDGSGGMTGSGGQMTITFICYTPAGSVIGFDKNASFVNGFTNATIEETGNFDFAGSDEYVYAYAGEVSIRPTTFLCAAASDNYALTGTNSLVGTGLTSGVNAWEYDVFGSPDEDILAYVGSTSGQATFSGYSGAINGTGLNWSSENGTGDQSSDNSSPDFSASTSYTIPTDFTITTICSAPANQPTNLAVVNNVTNVTGSFTAASGSPSGYLVVRYLQADALTAPSNGTYYCPRTALGSGTVVSFGKSGDFSDLNLNPSTAYKYVVYSFNSECSGAPFYNSISPLTANTTTLSSITNVETDANAIGPSSASTRAAASALNDAWEAVQQNMGLTCASGWNTVYGSVNFTSPSGTITGLVQTDISSSGTGTNYPGTVSFDLKNYDLDPDNSLGSEIVDLGTISGGSVIANSTSMQDNSASPDGVNEYFSHSTLSPSGRSGVEFNLSIPVQHMGFYLGDCETTTANNGVNPYTSAVVAVYNNAGDEIERKVISTASTGGNCVGTSSAGTVGCGSQETVWVDIESTSANISKVVVIVGDWVSDPSFSPNAGSDRGKNEFMSFGGFTLGGNCTTPVPVTLIDFSGRLQSINKVELTWQTASEENNSHFEIQKSLNGEDFQTIGLQEGAGNSRQNIDYQFVDNNFSADAFYRLKQNDYSGEYTYSEIVVVRQNQVSDSEYTLYPNPTKNSFFISGATENLEKIELISASGSSLFFDYSLETIEKLNLENGLYIVKIHNDQNVVVKRLIVLR